MCPRGEMDIIQVSGTWGLGSIPGEGMSAFFLIQCPSSFALSHKLTSHHVIPAGYSFYIQLLDTTGFLTLPNLGPTGCAICFQEAKLLLFLKEERIVAPSPSLLPRGQSMTRKKILIVEDNEDNRHILIYRLRKIGDFEIKEAQNGQEALAIIAQDPPDLLFLDLKLPILDGWETARRIRAMPSPMKDLPIIALTAQAMVGDEEKALAAGCSDYIAKPIIDSSIVKEKVLRFLPQVCPLRSDH